MSGNLPSSQSDSATNLTNSSNQAPILKVDDAIKTYLLRKGYHQAANALESEMKKSLHDSSSSSSRSSSLVLGEIPSFLLDIYSREVKEHVTFDDYKLLHEWIANSLDVVKPELLAINFPIFVHTYLLMRRQNNLEANDLLAYAGPDFIHDYTEEVNALSLFTDYEVRLSVTIFVQCAYQKPFRLRMSSTSFNLLKNFLLQHNMFPFLNMISSGRIVVTIYEPGDPHIYPHFATLEQYHRIAADPNSPGLTPIKWGVHGKTIYRPSDPTERDIFPDTNDPFYTNIMDNLILPNKILKASTPEEVILPSRMQPSSNVGAQSALEPNIIFATLMNTHDNMTSLHITKDCKQVAAGFSDSVIRLWTHDKEIGNISAPDESYDDSQTGYLTHPGGGSFRTVLPRAILTPLPDSSGSDAPPLKFQPTPNSSRQTGQKSNSNGYPYYLELRGHSKRVFSVCQEEYVTTGRIILSSGGDETIRLWDAYLGQCVAKYYTGEGLTWSVNFSPVGYYFIGTNQSRTASLYCTERPDALRVYRGHTSDVTCSSWHPNLSYFATGSDDRTARLWDIRTRAETVRCFSPLAPYTSNSSNSILSSLIASLSPVTSVQISPCGSILAVGYEDSTVVTWDIPLCKITSILVSEKLEKKKRKRKSSSSSSSSSTLTKESVSGLSFNSSKYSPIYSMAFSRDSNTLVTGGGNGTINIFNLSSINTLQIFNQQQKSNMNAIREIQDPILISPHHSFLTKHTPVYYVNYGTQNVIYGGGALCPSSY